MASPLSLGLTPSEIEFLCELELVTVIPRQRLEPLPLLGGSSPTLRPPHRADLPLWLALLLKRQRRVDIVPPTWLHPSSLSAILEREMNEDRPGHFTLPPPLPANATETPPFQRNSNANHTSEALPYYWLEMGHVLLGVASDDLVDGELVRRLLRDLREARLAKVRALMSSSTDFKSKNSRTDVGVELDAGAGIKLNGIGAMELSEARGFVSGLVDGLRRITSSREASERERLEEEAQEGRLDGRQGYDDEDDDMLM